MQPNQPDQSRGMPPYQTFPPLTPEEQMLWQQYYGAGQQPLTPEMAQYLQMQGISPQQVTPEMLQQWQYQMLQMQEMQLMQQMQQQPPMQPPAPPPKQRRVKPAKEERAASGGFGRVLRLLLILGVVGAGTWFIWQSMQGSAATTAVIEMGTLGTSYRGDALIVRNETAYEDEGVQSIEYIAPEGGMVYQGDLVCFVYSTGYNSKEISVLQDYRDQIKNYQRTLLKSQTQFDTKMDRLESEVVQRGLEVRNLVQGARGNLINQEKFLEDSINKRQAYFRTRYSTDMRLRRLYDDEETQQQRIDSWIKQHRANRTSIVSFYTDGFEHALTPAEFEKYTPAEVRAMINGQRPEVSTASRGRTNIYRLISQKDSYAVLMLVKDSTWNPVEGSTHKLKLEQFSNTVVDAQVRSFTRSGGELLLRLAVVGDVTPVIYMRNCQAELGEYADCMLVPSKAIFEQGGAKGVVLITEKQQLFVPVNVVQETAGKAYISAIQTGVLSVGQTVRLFR